MKTIVLYLKECIAEQWNLTYFLWFGTLLAVLFVLNYQFGFETSVRQGLPFPVGHVIFYYVLYFVPYVLAHAGYAVVQKEAGTLRDWRFWALSTGAFLVLAIYVTLHNGPAYLLRTQPWLFDSIEMQVRPFAARCASNFLPPTLMAIPLLVYWWVSDRGRMPPYGFSTKSIKFAPYFLLLVFLAPVVAAASFTPDFQQAYPRFKFAFPAQLPVGEQRLLAGLFEVCYGLDFVFVEFFFRGFLILAFSRLLGPRAVMPMVVVYALIHFEKPLLEALSSIIGGLVLGVISYRTKSIYGGVILHIGIAFMMEIAGTMQLLAR